MCFERGLGWRVASDRQAENKLVRGSLGFGKAAGLATRLGNALRRDLFLPDVPASSRHGLRMTSKGSVDRKPGFYCGLVPGSIYRLAVLAGEMNQKIEFDAVFPTAELMLPEWEAVIRKAFGCAVLPYYGSGEVNSLGYSHPAVGTYLVPKSSCLSRFCVRISRLNCGEGQFLITDLDNYAMPIIRYANGDAGKISDHGECGFPFTPY